MAGAAYRPGRGSAGNVLLDILKPGMVTVFCGNAPGTRSAARREYYAHKSNLFWRILAEIRLTPREFDSSEYPELATLRIGLTNLDQASVRSDEEVLRDHHNADAYNADAYNADAYNADAYNADTLCGKIEEYRPRILAFNGKTPAKAFLKEQFDGNGVDYGLQPAEYRLGDTEVFVLPSTASTGRRYWDKEHWDMLAALHRKILAE